MRKIVDPADLEKFRDGYVKAGEWRISPPPLPYLQQANVFALFRRGEIIGGFSLNSRRPWRYVTAMPEASRPEWESMLAKRDRVVEAGSLWLQRDYRRSWWYVLLLACVLWFSRGADVLLGADREDLASAYRAALSPERAESLQLDFDGDEGPGWVMFVERGRFAARAMRAAQVILHRRLPATTRMTGWAVPALLVVVSVIAAAGGWAELALVLASCGSLAAAPIGYRFRTRFGSESGWLLGGALVGGFTAFLVRGVLDPPWWLGAVALLAFLTLFVVPLQQSTRVDDGWDRCRVGARIAAVVAAVGVAWGLFLLLGVLPVGYHAVGAGLGLWLGGAAALALPVTAWKSASPAKRLAGGLVCGAALGLAIASELWRDGFTVPMAWAPVVGCLAAQSVLLLRRSYRSALAVLVVGLFGLAVGALFMPGMWPLLGAGALVVGPCAIASKRLKGRTRRTADNVGPRRWWILATLATAAGFVPAVDITALNVALPSLQQDLNADMGELTWVVDGYLVTYAALLLVFGGLGDRVGRKLLLCVGMVVFVLASVAAAMAESPEWLIGARAAQGLGAALIAPFGLPMIRHAFQGRELGIATAIYAASAGLGVAAGPAVGGVLVEHAGWASIFWINVPVVAVAFVATCLLVPEVRGQDKDGADPFGAFLVASGLLTLVWAVIEFRSAPWSTPVVSAGAVGLVLLAFFVHWETRAKNPLLPLAVFAHRLFTASVVSIGVTLFVLMGSFFMLPFYLQSVLGLSATWAGLSMACVAVALIATNLASPWLVSRLGTRAVVGMGLTTIAGAMFGVSMTEVDSGFWWPVGVCLLLVGIGMGAVMGPATASVTASLPPGQAGAAAAVDATVRAVAPALGVGIMSTVLDVVGQGFVHAMGVTVLCVALPVAVLGAVVAFKWLPGRRDAADAAQEEPVAGESGHQRSSQEGKGS